jgi:hypothetical protein
VSEGDFDSATPSTSRASIWRPSMRRRCSARAAAATRHCSLPPCGPGLTWYNRTRAQKSFHLQSRWRSN